MLFKCDRDELLKYVTYAEHIISARSTISILLCLLIETDKANGKINISGTDFKVGIRTAVNADILKEGSITLNANRVLNILKSFVKCQIVFEIAGKNEVKIYSDDPDIRTNFKIKGLASDEFPPVKSFPSGKHIEVEQGTLRNLIKKTVYAVSSQEDRIFLNGVLFVKKDKELKLVSTDGRRLGIIDYVLDSEDDVKELTTIVPSKVLYELMSVLSGDGVCHIATDVEENQIFFKIEGVEIVSNLLEGQFPNYNQVIPNKHTIDVMLPANDLYEAVRRVAVMADEKTGTIGIEIKDNQLTLIGTHPELGSSHDTLHVDYSGEPFKIAFNFNYVLDAIREFDEVEINLKASTSESPALLHGRDNENHIAVIMPVKQSAVNG